MCPKRIIIVTKLSKGITDDDDVVDVNYKDGSYLFLATEDGASTLEANIRTQLDAGVKVSRYVFLCQQVLEFAAPPSYIPASHVANAIV